MIVKVVPNIFSSECLSVLSTEFLFSYFYSFEFSEKVPYRYMQAVVDEIVCGNVDPLKVVEISL